MAYSRANNGPTTKSGLDRGLLRVDSGLARGVTRLG